MCNPMTRFKFLVGSASPFRGAIGVTTKIFLCNKPLIYPYNAILSVMLEPMIFLWQVFSILQKKYFKKQYYVINFTFKKIVKKPKKSIFFSKLTTIACNMKGCLRFYTFMFWILPNLAKYIHGLSPLEQHHKIEKNNKKNKKQKKKLVRTSIRGYVNWVIMLPVINLDLSNMP